MGFEIRAVKYGKKHGIQVVKDDVVFCYLVANLTKEEAKKQLMSHSKAFASGVRAASDVLLRVYQEWDDVIVKK